MSTTISSASTSQASLASALLSLTQQTTDGSSSADTGVDSTSGLDLDTLQLSDSSLSSLETSAQTIAAQNQNSVISTSEAALAVNLQAIAAMFQDPSSTQASQGTTDPSQVLKLVS